MKNHDSTLLKLLLGASARAPFIEDIEWELLLIEMDAFSATFNSERGCGEIELSVTQTAALEMSHPAKVNGLEIIL